MCIRDRDDVFRIGDLVIGDLAQRQFDRAVGDVVQKGAVLGVRARRCARYLLTPSAGEVQTPYGPIATKRGTGFGIRKEKPEYAAVAEAARRCGVPFQAVWEAAVKALEQEGPIHG